MRTNPNDAENFEKAPTDLQPERPIFKHSFYSTTEKYTISGKKKTLHVTFTMFFIFKPNLIPINGITVFKTKGVDIVYIERRDAIRGLKIDIRQPEIFPIGIYFNEIEVLKKFCDTNQTRYEYQTFVK